MGLASALPLSSSPSFSALDAVDKVINADQQKRPYSYHGTSGQWKRVVADRRVIIICGKNVAKHSL